MSDVITQFHQNLYKFEEVISEEDGFYDNFSRLSDATREQIECELTDVDLLALLNTCTDIAPRPDSI